MTDTTAASRQAHLGSYTRTGIGGPHPPFDEPPIPPNQEEIELYSPEATLTAVQDPSGDILPWLRYIESQYTPPDHVDVLLLYPCAGEKPMKNSRTYRALATTLSQYPDTIRRRIHVVTVSEPLSLIPYEMQNGEFVYDCPGLFAWWVRENGHAWNEHAQEQCLQILGDHIAGYLQRAVENDWYSEHIACVRRRSADWNLSSDQTHRRMLEHAEAATRVDVELNWLPSKDTVLSLTDRVGPLAWQMAGVSHESVQSELSAALDVALAVDAPDQEDD